MLFFVDFDIMSGTLFRMQWVRSACEAGNFSMDQFNLPRLITYFFGPNLKTVVHNRFDESLLIEFECLFYPTEE